MTTLQSDATNVSLDTVTKSEDVEGRRSRIAPPPPVAPAILKALRDNEFESVKSLIPAASEQDRGTALVYAISSSGSNKESPFTGIVEALLNPEYPFALDKKHPPLVCLAASVGNPELLGLLHARGFDINDSNMVTSSYVAVRYNFAHKPPIFIAAELGHRDAVAELIKLGAKSQDKLPMGQDFRGWTPTQIARQKGHSEIVSLLTAERVPGLFERLCCLKDRAAHAR